MNLIRLIPSGVLLAIIGGVAWSAVSVAHDVVTGFALPS